jgi:dihydroflavonol-4-reductase
LISANDRVLFIANDHSFSRMVKEKFISRLGVDLTLRALAPLNYGEEATFTDGSLVSDALPDYDYVIFMHSLIDYQKKSVKQLQLHNIYLIRQIANACLSAGVKGLVYIGSTEALDRNGEGFPIKEEDTWQKKKYRSEYSRSRYMGELEVWRAQAEGLDTLIISPANILMFPLESKTLQFIRHAATQGEIHLPVSYQAFCDERSVSDFLVSACNDKHCWNEKYLLTDGHITIDQFAAKWRHLGHLSPISFTKMTTWQYWMSRIAGVFSKKTFILHKEHFESLQLDQRFDTSKALATGYYHPVSIDDSLDHYSKMADGRM